MLQGITWASPPALRMPSAAASQASALRLEITTLAPSLASSSAEERPMPRLEPVTTATLPVRSNGVDCIVASLLVIPGCALLRAGPESILPAGVWMLNSNTGVMDSGLARRRAPRNDGALHQSALLA